jgi:hypothetical protein
MGYASGLGDATTPVGGGAGIVSQITSWFTGSVADAANSPQVVQQWAADVKARGNAVVRYPFHDDIGIYGGLAEREATGAGYSYYMAPANVLAADQTTRSLSTLAPATGKIAALAESSLDPFKNLPRYVVLGALAFGGIVVGSRFIGRR